MALSRDEIAFEEAKLKFRTAQLALVTTILGILGYVAFELIRYFRYIHTPAAVERAAEAAQVPCGECEARPFVLAEAVGPDLKVQAGLDLRLTTEKTPYGTGQLEGEISDYPPGKYKLEDAPNARQVVALLRESLVGFLPKDQRAFSVETEIIGSADGIPVRAGAVYRGDLGPIDRRLYHSYDEGRAKHMTLVPNTSPLSNEVLAFLRAFALIQHTKTIPTLARATTSIGVDTTHEIGGQHRRVIVKVSVKGALQEEYDALGPLAKWIRLKIPKPS